MKALLNAIHALVQKAVHVCLVPVITVLKAVDAAAQHLITELSKI